MTVEHRLKRLLAISLISFLLMGSAIPAVSWARTEARYELITGDIIFGNDLAASNSKQSLFHQQTLHTFDKESLNIDFPVFDRFSADGINNDLALGPTAISANGITASANILPFGPVNLAFPSIAQKVDQGYAASSTGFYTANFLGIPPINAGGAPVMSGIGFSNIPVSSPSSLVGSNMMFPEMVNTIAATDRSKALAAAAKASDTASGNKAKSSLSLPFSSMIPGSG